MKIKPGCTHCHFPIARLALWKWFQGRTSELKCSACDQTILSGTALIGFYLFFGILMTFGLNYIDSISQFLLNVGLAIPGWILALGIGAICLLIMILAAYLVLLVKSSSFR